MVWSTLLHVMYGHITFMGNACCSTLYFSFSKLRLYSCFVLFAVALPIDPAKSYVTATSAIVVEQAQFTLHTRDRDGKETKVHNTDDVTAKLVVYEDNKVVECTIKEVCEDKCIFEYEPFSAGTLDLYVKVKGEQVNGTPHTIVVREPEPVSVIQDGLDGPNGITIDSNGRVITTEWEAGRVSIFTPEGYKVKSLRVFSPLDITVDDHDNVYVLNSYGVHKFTPDGEAIKEPTKDSSHPLQFKTPNSIAFNPHNKKLYICEGKLGRIQVVGTDLSFSRTFGSKGYGFGQFRCPRGISCDGDGTVYVADSEANNIQVFSPDGKFQLRIGCGTEYLDGPTDITVHHNRMWVCDEQGDVKVYSTSYGQFIGCPFRNKHGACAIDNSRSVVAFCFDSSVYIFRLQNLIKV